MGGDRAAPPPGLTAVALALAACAPAGGDGGTTRLPAIEIAGRVVDAETCASVAGCQGVAGVVVAWAGAVDRVRSAPSALDGSFTLDGLPAGVRADLLATPPGGYAPTLNPAAVGLGDDDVDDLELFVLPLDEPSLLSAFRRETGSDLVQAGGYVGQALTAGEGGMAALAGAAVVTTPSQGAVRYVNVLPRYVEGEPALRPLDAGSTGPFGLFVVPARAGAVDAVLFAPTMAEREIGFVVSPLSPGIVAFGLHPAR